MTVLDADFDAIGGNRRVTNIVRDVANRTGGILNQVLPDNFVQTRSFRIKSYDRTQGASEYRNWDTPAPVAPREGFTETTGQIPPLSEQIIIGEDETLGIFERAVAGEWGAIEQEIFNDAARLTRRINNRIEQARGQVLLTSKFTLTAENGLTLEADFGRDAGNTVARSAAWSVITTDIIGDIRGVIEKSRDERDMPVDTMIMSSATLTNMLLNTGIGSAIYTNAANLPSLVSQDLVSALMTAHGLPDIFIYDHKIDGNRTITVDEVIFFPRGQGSRLGSTEWGVTAESLSGNLVEFGSTPGPVGMVMSNADPVWKSTKVSALAMPVLNDTNLIYTMDTEA